MNITLYFLYKVKSSSKFNLITVRKSPANGVIVALLILDNVNIVLLVLGGAPWWWSIGWGGAYAYDVPRKQCKLSTFFVLLDTFDKGKSFFTLARTFTYPVTIGWVISSGKYFRLWNFHKYGLGWTFRLYVISISPPPPAYWSPSRWHSLVVLACALP